MPQKRKTPQSTTVFMVTLILALFITMYLAWQTYQLSEQLDLTLQRIDQQNKTLDEIDRKYDYINQMMIDNHTSGDQYND